MKSKLVIIAITILAMLVITCACFGVYCYVDNCINKVEVEEIKDFDMSPLYTLENYPKVDASLATQPLTNAFIKNFTGVEDISDEYLDYSNTHPAYIKLVDGEKDLIVVTEPSKEELEYAKQKGVELEVIPVVREGFVFYVNNENNVKDLSLKQIQDIYSGVITNWKDVGGKDAPIQAFQRPENSGSQTGMLSLVMKDIKLMEPKKEDIVQSMFDIINLVSNFDNGVDSIGYSYYYYATTIFQDLDSDISNRIRLLSIDGVKPENKTIKDGSYPLQTAYNIVIRKDEPENSEARKLANYMLSERGQFVAEETGYVGVK